MMETMQITPSMDERLECRLRVLSEEESPSRIRPPASIMRRRESDERMAEHLAYKHLTQACLRALFDLSCTIGRATNSRDVRAGLLASEMLREMLLAWHERLQRLREADPNATFTEGSPPLTTR